MLNTTLCYIEKDSSYLMLHRVKKQNDLNKDKWIGIGGKFEEGESPEDCVLREAKEETELDVELKALLGIYSDPTRDPRRHTMTTVFIAHPRNPNAMCGGDDALRAFWCPLDALPALAFDHAKILSHFSDFLRGVRRVADVSES